MAVYVQSTDPYLVRDGGTHSPIQAPRRDLEEIMVASPDPRQSDHNGRRSCYDWGPYANGWDIGERRVYRQRGGRKDHRASVEKHDCRVRTWHTIRTNRGRALDSRQAQQTNAETVI